MSDRTCAACECRLKIDVISVKLGGKTVEFCCEESAVSPKEPHACKENNKKDQAMCSSQETATTRRIETASAWYVGTEPGAAPRGK